MDLGLRGKTAIVCGASSGLGLASAEALADEGANVAMFARRREELESLRESTISALEVYDREHDTELLATLQSFLTHHGSTTETAEAMHLHRHTVGYRLTRVQEVSGLSPYETDGRERLGLGLKAHQILEADRRRSERE